MLRRGIGRVGRPGLIGTMARTAVVAGTATAVSGGVARRQQERAQQAADAQAWQQQQQQAAAAPPVVPAEPAAPAPAATDVVTQLKELAALKDQGILTEEEFAAQKSRILA
jgi:Short C-terminal domain